MEQDKKTAAFEKMKVKGSQLVDKMRDLIDEGNARRITIKKDGRVLMEFPLSVGVGGATAALLLTPQLAAVGAIAALVSDVEVEVEPIKKEDELLPPTTPPPPHPSDPLL